MLFIYNLSIRFYSFLIRLASPFSDKASHWVSGRKADLSIDIPEGVSTYWFHCASLGEFDQGTPVMEELKKREPTCFILVTFFSPSGYLNYKKRNVNIDYACYLPIDNAKKIKAFVEGIRPKALFIVKYEFWHHLIFETKKYGAKIYSISTLLRADHRFFKWYGGFFKQSLYQIDHFYVQNEKTKNLLNSISINACTITGDTRYDKVIHTREQKVINPIVERFTQNKSTPFIAGSCWAPDEACFIEAINKGIITCAIIAPHDISDKTIQRITSQLTTEYIRYSDVQESTDLEGINVLLLDTIGHLSSCYRYAEIAFIGGGFTGKLHNILEPAVFGLPVFFGPKFNRFPEAQQFIDHGFGFTIADHEEFEKKYLSIQPQKEDLAKKARFFVNKNEGASVKIIDSLFNIQ